LLACRLVARAQLFIPGLNFTAGSFGLTPVFSITAPYATVVGRIAWDAATVPAANALGPVALLRWPAERPR